MAHIVERSIKIYNGEDDNYIYIGPDADGMGFVEISCSEDDHPPMNVTKEEAVLIARAIIELYGGNE